MSTLFAAPLAFGAVQTWAWTTLTVIAVVLLIFWAIGTIQQGVLSLHCAPIYVPAALFLLLATLQFSAHLTLDPFATREALIQLTIGLIFFFLASELWVTASQQTWDKLGLATTLYAFFLSLFAIIQFFSTPFGVIYWRVKTQGWAFGPYVNHNHYGGLMEMLIPVAATFVISRPSEYPAKAMLAFGVMVPIVSVLLSASRGAFLSLLVEALILGLILFRHRRRLPGQNRPPLFGVAIIFVALLFFSLAARSIPMRLKTVAGLARSPEVTLGERWVVWKDSLGIISNHPLIGTGLGSFAVAFPSYQSFATNQLWDHAHNDYLEVASETGLVGLILVLSAMAFLLRQAFGNLGERLEHRPGWIQLGAAVGVCGLLVHSFSDFNLHIPANAMWFAVFAGLAVQEFVADNGILTGQRPL